MAAFDQMAFPTAWPPLRPTIARQRVFKRASALFRCLNAVKVTKCPCVDVRNLTRVNSWIEAVYKREAKFTPHLAVNTSWENLACFSVPLVRGSQRSCNGSLLNSVMPVRIRCISSDVLAAEHRARRMPATHVCVCLCLCCTAGYAHIDAVCF